MNNILSLHKVKGIVKGSRCKLHIHFIGKIIKRYQILGIQILNGHAKAYILHSHFHQFFQCGVASVKAILKPPDLIIGLFQPFNRNADPNIRKFPAQLHDPVCKKAVCRNDNSVTFFAQLPDNFLQICADKGFSSCDIGKIHRRQLFDRFKGDLLLRLRRFFVSATHITAGITAISHDHCSV